MKICSIVGARPNFIKLAPISKELRKRENDEIIIHTGQHYDEMMSGVFFKSMNIPVPDYNLGVQEKSHGMQIGKMIMGIESLLENNEPDVVLVFGDTNSTLAGAITASKLNIPVAHIESGCRSYDMSMPEESNRIMVDHISDSLYASTEVCRKNLIKENVYGNVECFGDLSVDVINEIIKTSTFDPLESDYILTTIHRPSNTDSIENLTNILSALDKSEYNILFPVHPRTNKILNLYKLKDRYTNITFCDPCSYRSMIHFIKHAKMIVTDSGGIQKEAYLLQVPCITVRNTTEWSETLEYGWNQIMQEITETSLSNAISNMKKPSAYTHIFGNIGVTSRIVDSLMTIYEE